MGPTSESLGETEFVNGVAAMSASGLYGPARACAGIIGNVDLRFGDRAGPALEAHIAARLDAFVASATSRLGTKTASKRTSANPPPGLLLDHEFRKGFAALGRSD